MKKLLFLCFFLLSMTAFSQEQFPGPVVTVIGKGIVNVVPDEVVINARIEHTGESAAIVKQKNDKVVNQVLDFLKKKGIPSKNIQTEYLNLNKNYDYNTKEYSYSANQAISIQLDDLERYEEIISGLLQSGLNRIDGIEFRTSRRAELESEARKEAMLDAREKARELATAVGQSIGKAVSINEMGNNRQPVFRTMSMESKDSSAEQTIAPGEMEITVEVNVSFVLRDPLP